MTDPDELDAGWDDTDEVEFDDLNSESELDTEATVICPYCGEPGEITLDPGGGKNQQYVEDCAVCCRPWAVHVNYSDEGTVDVWLEETG